MSEEFKPKGLIWNLDKIVERIEKLEQLNLEQEEHIQNLEGHVSDCQEEIAELKKEVKFWDTKVDEWYDSRISNLKRLIMEQGQVSMILQSRAKKLESLLMEFFTKNEYKYYAKKLGGEKDVSKSPVIPTMEGLLGSEREDVSDSKPSSMECSKWSTCEEVTNYDDINCDDCKNDEENKI